MVDGGSDETASGNRLAENEHRARSYCHYHHTIEIEEAKYNLLRRARNLSTSIAARRHSSAQLHLEHLDAAPTITDQARLL